MSKKKSNRITNLWGNLFLRNIFLAVLSVIILLVLSNVFLDTFTRHGKSAPVPSFIGKSLDSVLIIAQKNDLRIEVIDSVFRIDIPRGSVLQQNPEPGTHVKKNRKIFLTMNSFSPRKEAVPDVRDISLKLAKINLAAKGFRTGKLEYSYEHPYTNNVFKQMYRGREIEPGIMLPTGEYIDLKLGLKMADDSIPAITNVPDVSGLAKQAAEDLIIENSLNYILVFDRKGVKTVTDSLNCVAYGQEPPAGSIARYGDNVRIKLKLPEKGKK
ncbi:MAG: PASTA domain-containing protein [Prevotellaceae bacterium]|jgi:beta-lactam-binding protein with PASTA domain|nr:PASTA domain-containing protein [Prevotellaceae bacterium]